MSARVRRRSAVNVIVLTLSVATALTGLAFLALIGWTLISRGIAAINLDLFTLETPPPGSPGGLANAIVGSAMMTGLAMLIATPIGILAGTYLAEYGRHSRFGTVARFINDVLLSAPSILVGLFVYGFTVLPMKHYSGWAGAIALSLIALPVIVRSTQDMIGLVPVPLREAAAALGAPEWRVMVSIVWRAAGSGMLTGVLLAMARISGETAPLLFTALNNQFWSLDLNAPMANLPVVIYRFALSPYDDWQQLAWGGAFLITFVILVLNVLARVVSSRNQMKV
jgi:phosphate transport system permease protein